MFRNYIKVALRTLLKHKVYSFINIIGLSVGIACCMLIFLYGKDELSFDRFHENKDNIYRVTADFVMPNGQVNKTESTGMMPGPAFKKDIPEIESFTRIQSASFNVKSKNEIIEQDALWADENLFTVFSFPFLYGNPASALNDLHSVVISEDVANKFFGKSDVLGQTMVLNAGEKFEPFVISGVTKKSPQNSSVQIQMILPMKLHQLHYDDTHWQNFFLNTFVVIKPGSNIKSIEEKFQKIYHTEAAASIKEMAEKYNDTRKTFYHLQPLLQIHLSTDYPAVNGLTGASNPIYSYILTSIAAFILIIACINFINLTVARSLKRAREIGIRKVVGSSKKQLAMQFLGESFVVCFFSFLLACLITYLTLPFFNQLANKHLSFSYLLDSKLIASYVALFLITGLLAGFYPALVLSGFKPADTLYGKFQFNGKTTISKSLVVLQFVLSTFLIISTITIYSQFSYLINFDLGYDKNNVVSVNTGSMMITELNTLKHELKKIPSIKQVTADQGGQWTTMANINGGTEINFDFKHVDENFFPTFKIPVIKGRNFSAESAIDTVESVMVNESFVKKAGWKNPIGQVVDFFYNNKKFNVIGVIKDYHFAALTQEVQPQLFSMQSDYSYGQIYVRIDPKNKAHSLEHIEKTIKKFHPEQPYLYKFLEDKNLEHYESEAKWKQIIACSALLTIFISCIGLLGLAALSAEKRAREIGIRKVLGASVASITKKLSLDFIKLVVIAACLALPIAWWAMNTWLEDYPYRIELSFYLFIASVTIVLAIAALTVGFQSVKAAMANPIKNLRTE